MVPLHLVIKNKQKRLTLRTWQLTPIDLSSPLWECSSIQHEVFVRAPTSVRARSLAAEKFRQPPSGHASEGAVTSPWLDMQLVRCVRRSDMRFESYHSEVVLDLSLARRS